MYYYKFFKIVTQNKFVYNDNNFFKKQFNFELFLTKGGFYPITPFPLYPPLCVRRIFIGLTIKSKNICYIGNSFNYF